MRLLVSGISARVEGGNGSVDTIKPVVSLMVKLMRRPTFYTVSLPGSGRGRSLLTQTPARTWLSPMSIRLPRLSCRARHILQPRSFSTCLWLKS